MSDTTKRSERLDIRKYPNRRYYDATRSRHLTLEEIRSLVHDGCDIKVTDSKSGADITAQVLTQIILELETSKLETFPVNMLVQMIRANERAVTDFMQKYFDQAFTAYMEYQKQMEERFRQLHTMPPGINPFAAWSEAMFTPFAARKTPAPEAFPAGAEPQTSRDVDKDMAKIVSDLQQEIADLRRELKKKRTRRRA